MSAPALHGEHDAGISTGRTRLLGLSGLLIAIAITCLPKLDNAFVWDDIPMIVESDRLFDASNLPSVFRHDTMFTADGGKFQAQAQLDTYRPITMATFFLDAALTGRTPFAYHLDNLLAHLICVALVYAWSLRLLGTQRWRAALAAAAFFGFHPVLAEGHIWINGRSDPYCTLFGLAGALVYTSERDALALWSVLTSAALFLLGLLSKETLAPFLIVLVLWDAGVFERELTTIRFDRAKIARTSAVVVALAIYVFLRAQALSGLRTSAGAEQVGLALSRLPVLLVDGLRATLAPSRVMPPYLSEEYAQLSGTTLAAYGAVVGSLALLTFRLRTRCPSLAFGLCGFAAVLAPASLIATMAWYGFGRYLYLPIALLAPGLVELTTRGIAWLGAHAPLAGRAASLGAIAYLALFAIRLSLSIPSWDGPLAFYQAIIAESPDASHGHGGLGKYYVDRAEYAKAVGELARAVELAPSDSRYLNNLGVAFLRLGRFDQARHVAELGLSRFPQHQAKFEKLRLLASQR